MVFNTATVGLAVTPAIISTWFSHYLNRKPLHQKPTAHISYDVGLHLIRQFLIYSSNHTIEEIQAFTTRGVPNPRWVRVEDIEISGTALSQAAEYIQAQLGSDGIAKVGGSKWWQWRRDGSKLKAEWIEMRKDYKARRKSGENCSRCMMYVHGGAYYFGSVDEHRYQMQRHARKLKARVFAPRYRLAPQFPFPCGLQDCLAAYLYLLNFQEPETIVLAGDSAGGGMLVSLMVILRDQGLPMPAGAILLSPWVDLTHSFPSVAGNSPFDYVPAHGFIHRPSPAWPPPNADEMKSLESILVNSSELKQVSLLEHHEEDLSQRLPNGNAPKSPVRGSSSRPQEKSDASSGVNSLTTIIEGKNIHIEDQIQIYTTNQLLSHPLVSPVLQPTLGGLPPILILVGGGEMLRDEQIYLAHKAANPAKYPAHRLDFSTPTSEDVNRYPPTNVQLQVWEDLCHVAATLSFTRPAKYMYRSVAQFGAWALARAQKKEIQILDDDQISFISTSSKTSTSSTDTKRESRNETEANRHERKTRTDKPVAERGIPNGESSFPTPERRTTGEIGKAGDPLPPFQDHMIRQKVSRHGEVTALDPPSMLPACCMKVEDVGNVKPGPVQKWLKGKSEWDRKFARELAKMTKLRLKQAQAGGYEVFANEKGDGLEAPPPTALAGRRKRGVKEYEPSTKKSKGLAIWTAFGSMHDKSTLEREENLEIDNTDDAPTATVTGDHLTAPIGQVETSRSRSRMRSVTDAGQTGEHDTWAATRAGIVDITTTAAAATAMAPGPSSDKAHVEGEPRILVTESRRRPSIGGVAIPFKLAPHLGAEHENPSTLTLHSFSIPGDEGAISPTVS